jgi:hypothetical protein
MMLWWRRVAAAAVGHGNDVRTALEGLVEVADVAGDVFVSRDGEGNDGLDLANVSTDRPLVAGR